MKTTVTRSRLALLALLLLPSLALASASVEVVQSVPLETTLAVPGLRQAQEVWLEMIRGAQHTLDLEQFYVSDQAGEALQPVIQAIQAAATRGVRVRLLADSKMDATYPDSVAQIGSFPNSESRLINFSNLGGIQHAKFFIVDGNLVFVGSQNFDWRALSHIHEIGLRIADAKIASDLSAIFERDWRAGTPLPQQGSRPAAAPNGAASEVLASVPGVLSSGLSVVASPAVVNPAGIPDSLSGILGLMKSASRSIVIQVMEYSTSVFGQSGTHWRALDDGIRAAASRGVHVRLMLDVTAAKRAKSDLKALASLPNIEVRSVTIPDWSGGKIDYARLIHSKYLVVDGGTSAWVGTENWSQGYFMNSRDVGLLVSDPTVSGQLQQVYERVWGSSYASSVQNL